MCDIDEKVVNVHKAFLIIFIIGITVINAILIIKTMLTPKFMYRSKNIILISLSFGDIFLALFSLVVRAMEYFQSAELSCSTDLTAEYYQQFIIHFVYGVGIVVLTIEFVVRQQRKSELEDDKIIKSFIYSAVPWVLMLIVILPLTMADVNWDTCSLGDGHTSNRIVAKFWVSVLIPAIAAVNTCLVVVFVNIRPAEVTYLRLNPGVVINNQEPGEMQRVIPIDTILCTQESSDTPYENRTLGIQYPHHTSQNGHSTQQQITDLGNDPNTRSQPAVSNQPSRSTNQYSQHKFHDNQEANYSIGQQQQDPTPFTNNPENSSNYIMWNPVKQKRILLAVAVVHFLCVVPQAGFSVSYHVDYDCSFIIWNLVFYWLSNLRSLITPIIWIVSSRKTV